MPSKKQRRHIETLFISDHHRSSVSSGRVTRSQAGTGWAWNPVLTKLVLHGTKGLSDVSDLAQLRQKKGKDLANPSRHVLDKSSRPDPPPLSPLTYHSGGKKASPSKGTWAAAAAHQTILSARTPTLQQTGEKSRPALPFAVSTDNYGGSRAEGASSRSSRLTTPLENNPGASLASTAAVPTSLTDNSGDIARERTVDAAPHTIPPTLPTDNPEVSITSPPAASPTSQTDN